MVIGTAVAADLLLGEPPARRHPVVWIGRLIGFSAARMPRTRARGFVSGAILAVAMPAAAAIGAAFAESGTNRLPAVPRVISLSLALKPAFAVGELLDAGERVQTCLQGVDLDRARLEARALVSRDTSGLDASLLSAAAIESLSENLTDSVVAPLLAFAVAGLPGAYFYRAVNTLDSMVGYRGEYEWLGKAPARLDDALNFVPARLATALIVAAAALMQASPRAALRAARRDHGRTASPNAGWTMAAAAGALGVRLEKRGYYVLNAAGRAPEPADISAARRLVSLAAGGAVVLACGVAALRSVRRRR